MRVVEVEVERLVADVMSSEPHSSFRSSKRLVGGYRMDGDLDFGAWGIVYVVGSLFISLYSMHFAV